MTDFFIICSIESPQCTDKCSKKNYSIAIFLRHAQKHEIPLPVALKPKTSKMKNRCLNIFLSDQILFSSAQLDTAGRGPKLIC